MSDSLTPSRGRPASKGEAVSFPEGADLLDFEHRPCRIYLLNTGKVRLAGRNGVIFDHLKSGSFCGEKLLVTAGSGDQVATALSPVTAAAFRKSDLLAE